MTATGWVVRDTAGCFLAESVDGFGWAPGILGAYAFDDEGEARLYAERSSAGRPADTQVIPNPFHRCAGCGCVSRDGECPECHAGGVS